VDYVVPRDHVARPGTDQLAAGFAAVLVEVDDAAGADVVVLGVDEALDDDEPEAADDVELLLAPVEEVVVDRESLR
jgi:hypothetical protein